MTWVSDGMAGEASGVDGTKGLSGLAMARLEGVGNLDIGAMKGSDIALLKRKRLRCSDS